MRLYAPDMPGQSIRGPEVKLSLKDDSYANWLIGIVMIIVGGPVCGLIGAVFGSVAYRILR